MKTLPATSIFLMAIILLAINACGTNDSYDPIDLDLVTINSVTASGFDVTLFSSKNLEQGVNTLYWQVEQNGDVIGINSFQITPKISLNSTEYSSPFTTPARFEENRDYHSCTVVFTHPGTENDRWNIDFEITTKTNESIQGTIPVEVTESWKVKSATGMENATYYLSWEKPETPVTGVNGLDLRVYKQENPMQFTPVGGGVVTISPYINLGNGSIHTTNYGDAISVSPGVYRGYIDFDRKGHWITTAKLSSPLDTLRAVTFAFNVDD